MVFRKDVKKAVKKAYRGVKTVTGNRYGRGLRQIATKGIPQMASDIYKLKMLMNVEKKQKEAAYSSILGQVDANNSGWYAQDVTPIYSQGLGYTSRNGRSVKLTGATMHWQFQEQTAQLVRMKVKVLVIQVIGNPFTSSANMVQEFMDANPLTNLVDYYSDRNPQNFKQFKILSNKVVTMYPDQQTTTGRCVTLKVHLKLKNHIKYNNDTDGVVDGQIYVLALAENGNCNVATASTIVEIPVRAANTGLQVRLYNRFYAVDN